MKVIYEDDAVMVVDKPAGWVVNRAESVSGDTVQDWAEKSGKLKMTSREETESEMVFKKRSGIAHRLDKETSGCLVIGKTPEALGELMRQFKDREVKKEYLTVVHGQLEPVRGVVRLPIGRNQKDRKQRMVHYSGKTAESAWFVEKIVAGGKYSLVHVWPKTGRTHQIRVHLKFLGHTVVGDKLYGSENEKRQDGEVAARQLLHALKISFTHPVSGERVEVESQIPDDIQKIISGNGV